MENRNMLCRTYRKRTKIVLDMHENRNKPVQRDCLYRVIYIRQTRYNKVKNKGS